MNGQTRKLSNLYESKVYTTNGVRVGRVVDVRLDFGTCEIESLVLEDLNNNIFSQFAHGHKGVTVPYRWVRGSDEVVIVIDSIENISDTGDSQADDSQQALN